MLYWHLFVDMLCKDNTGHLFPFGTCCDNPYLNPETISMLYFIVTGPRHEDDTNILEEGNL
jgi:hypothetical protein